MTKDFIIATKNITKTYFLGNIRFDALKGVSIDIPKGELASIAGKSGSGKSTLMHIMGLLDTPTTGKVYLNGKNVSHLSEQELARIRNKEVGFVFQSFNLLQRTSVVDNVMLPLKYSKTPRKQWMRKVNEILELVELSDFKQNKSNELSGGQKQRVAIARALINNPSIILADEPTGNLDSKTGNEIIQLFIKLNKQGTTVIIVTHDEEIANKTRRKFIIKDGKIIK